MNGVWLRFWAAPQLHLVRPHMRKWRYRVALPFIMSLSGCIEITTYLSPSASGTVIDAASKKPIQGATISVDDHPGLFAQTNSDGQFLLVPAMLSLFVNISLCALARLLNLLVVGPYMAHQIQSLSAQVSYHQLSVLRRPGQFG